MTANPRSHCSDDRSHGNRSGEVNDVAFTAHPGLMTTDAEVLPAASTLPPIARDGRRGLQRGNDGHALRPIAPSPAANRHTSESTEAEKAVLGRASPTGS